MQLKTKDLIQILPFETEFKNRLLSDFDNLTPDQRFEIVEIVWDAYDAYYDLQLQNRIDDELVKASEGQDVQLDNGFYKRIKDQLDSELRIQMTQVTTTEELSQTREELEKILSNQN